MSNFLFLQTEFPDLFAAARTAENYANSDPRAACFYARRALEVGVEWLFDHDQSLPTPYDSLGDNLRELGALRFFPKAVHEKARLLQRVGNEAVHGALPPDGELARSIVGELFHLFFWVARTYAKQKPADSLAFEPQKLPPSIGKVVATSRAQVEALAQQLRGEREDYRTRLSQSEAEIEELRQELALAKKKSLETPDTHDYSEAKTREILIDVLLREAGWLLADPRDREFPVEGMPSESGNGRVDYVLWGDDGLPLAVVEAKRASKSPHDGQEQARQYADCLAAKFGRRPVVFYSNGYEHYLWDEGNGYPPRQVQGFYSKAELERLVGQRTTRVALGSVAINQSIAGRAYQTRAIRAWGEHLENRHRKGLLVMATGTGKTRTTIALVDMLMNAGWAKRVLFLADRKALVDQAWKQFKKHLPSSSPQNLVEDKAETGARVLCCTYPTMMNLIEGKDADAARRFGVGHFDLVVVDEAHRSVYQKYGAIFEYFDSLLLGLTATPRDEVDKDTYKLFDLKKGAPTSFYEMEEAVSDGFLVPAKLFAGHLKFPMEGIKYAQLPDEEKAEWDEREWGEEGAPDEVPSAAVNAWLFNADTVDKVLKTLMTSGLKVGGGAQLGKTIIFARNQKHAEFICERFNLAYPSYAGHFASVIHSEITGAQSLIDAFSTPNKQPTIAISVDMLDTGIDVPEIVNLVFFKPVRSKTKFAQMIGRGTRLCPDLLDVGVDKREFFVFDFCGNLEFFEAKPEGIEAPAQVGLDQRIFERRVELLRLTGQMGPELAELRREWADALHAEVAAMNRDNFVVRAHGRQVERWNDRARWETISDTDADEIKAHLAALPTELPSDEPLARRFDLTCLRLQLALLHASKEWAPLQKEVRDLAQNLLEKAATLPDVRAKEPLLVEVTEDEWWRNASLPALETLRRGMRDLVGFADKSARLPVYTDFEDSNVRLVEHAGLAPSPAFVDYRKRVRAWIESQRHHPAIRKLHENEPLAPDEWALLDEMIFGASGFPSRADYEAYFGPQPKLGEFVRSVVGLDRAAAKKAFGAFLDGATFTAAQMDFIGQLLDLLAQNGIVEPGQLIAQPFTHAHPSGALGLFPSGADQLAAILRDIQARATPSH